MQFCKRKSLIHITVDQLSKCIYETHRYLRIVCFGDAHELDRVSGLTIRMIFQAQLPIGLLYFRNLSTLPHNSLNLSTLPHCNFSSAAPQIWNQIPLSSRTSP